MTIHLILFSGGINDLASYARYKNDITKALSVFMSVSANVSPLIFFEDGSTVFEIAGRKFSSLSATAVGFTNEFSSYISKVFTDDTIVFIASNHGGVTVPGSDKVHLWGWNETIIRDTELAAAFSPVQASRKVFILGQCYSGGFIEQLEAKDTVILSACKSDELSWATEDLLFDEFLFHVLEAISKSVGNLRDVFVYAKTNDKQKETPQFSDPGNIAQSLYLS